MTRVILLPLACFPKRRTLNFAAFVVVLSTCVLGASPTPAAVIGFVNNPTTNSIDWTNQVNALGGQINTNVDFDAHPVGTLAGGFYSGSDGVTLATTGPFSTSPNVVFGTGPGQPNNTSLPVSTGEGAHAASNYLQATGSRSPGTLTIDFGAPVLGVGLFVIDLFSPANNFGTLNIVDIEAFTGAGGTGASLGTFSNAQFNFQTDNLYFMGLVSTAADIQSLIFTHAGNAGALASSDSIGIDDIRFATLSVSTPEPTTLALLSLGLAGLGVSRRKVLRQ